MAIRRRRKKAQASDPAQAEKTEKLGKAGREQRHPHHAVALLRDGHHAKDSDITDWQKERSERSARLNAGSRYVSGKMVPPDKAKALLEAIIRPGDRVCLEGDNQKQADFLAGCLAKADPKVLHDLHVVQSGIVLPEHVDLFEKGIAKKLDFSYSGPQSHAVPRVLKSGKVELGAIHTYIELFARYFVDLTPHVA